MARIQLNIRLDEALLSRLALAARSAGIPPSTLARSWLQERLDASTDALPPRLALSSSDCLEQRLAELETRLAVLERRGPEPPARPMPEPAGACPKLPGRATSAPASKPAVVDAGIIPTAELAEATGTNRAGWNNWATAARIGTIRNHPQAGPWRLVGKVPAPGGGPERWMWQRQPSEA